MNSSATKTYFAPAARRPVQQVEFQHRELTGKLVFRELVDHLPSILLVLNSERQIVFANQPLLDFAGAANLAQILGMRPGEVLRCVHSCELEGGCGTSEFCGTCGAVKAILASQQGLTEVQECRILQLPESQALDLRVWTWPLAVGGSDDDYTAFIVLDIGDEKRRQLLERMFFHDILNTVTSIYGFARLLKKSDGEQTGEYTDFVIDLVHQLIDEIYAQRDLNAAERRELAVKTECLETREILQQLAGTFSKHETAQGKVIRVDERATAATLTSDKVLVYRVLNNMVKNALEASDPGSAITLGSDRKPDSVELWVHNPGFIPREVQLQIFQRSFSTKGAGRGLGTYSMKLFGEHYLKGRVFFASDERDGTRFTLSLPFMLCVE